MTTAGTEERVAVLRGAIERAENRLARFPTYEAHLSPDDLRALLSELARLRRALVPFKRTWSNIPERLDKNQCLYVMAVSRNYPEIIDRLAADDFRQAARALEGER